MISQFDFIAILNSSMIDNKKIDNLIDKSYFKYNTNKNTDVRVNVKFAVEFCCCFGVACGKKKK